MMSSWAVQVENTVHPHCIRLVSDKLMPNYVLNIQEEYTEKEVIMNVK